MTPHQGKSITRTATLALLITATAPTIIMSGFWIHCEFQQYLRQTDQLITEFTAHSKQNIMDEVGAFTKLINHKMDLAKVRQIASLGPISSDYFFIANTSGKVLLGS